MTWWSMPASGPARRRDRRSRLAARPGRSPTCCTSTGPGAARLHRPVAGHPGGAGATGSRSGNRNGHPAARGEPRQAEQAPDRRGPGHPGAKQSCSRVRAGRFYKHIAGMNAVRLRHALLYATTSTGPTPRARSRPSSCSMDAADIQGARTPARSSCPTTTSDRIGGYEDVKVELRTRARRSSAARPTCPSRCATSWSPAGSSSTGRQAPARRCSPRRSPPRSAARSRSSPDRRSPTCTSGRASASCASCSPRPAGTPRASLVFDEFDSIAAKRTGRDDGGSRAGNAVVAQLLTELDGFRPEVPVLIIGTTNRIDMIDEALLRPSRFRRSRSDLPMSPARKEIARGPRQALLRHSTAGRSCST